MAKIKEIIAQEILNAKGVPTIEATVILNNGITSSASCPSGETAGAYEALDLKDKDQNRFDGQGVLNAINNIKTVIAPALIGKEAENQPGVDKTMIDLDGTQNKSRLGGNAMLSVSMAVAKAAAESSVLPLFMYLKQFIKKDNNSFLKIPIPIFNIINGGKNSKIADFYEFLVLPASSKPYAESIQIGEAIYRSFKSILQANGLSSLKDYNEDTSLSLPTNKEAFSLMKQAITDANTRLGFDVFFGLNSKASNLYKDGKYHIKDNSSPLSSKDLVNYYDNLNKEVHLLYLEDPLSQDDWDGWSDLYARLAATTIIAGGDLIATNPYRLQIALGKKTINGITVKPNQVGTVIESLAIAEAAKETGVKIIVSHRTNETNDDFLADFAVAVSADYVKLGDLTRGENIAKYNRLLQIENQLKIL
ncbi:MAG: phosphopyruvate hydratase [Candidatus Levybacteria bacterium]|nr:phosphopyruvate hydratase [Candidatus Levybacteria bacterium]